MNGVEFTAFSPAALSQNYLDFASIQEIHIASAGHDVTTGSSGAVLDFLTYQGAKVASGSMQFLYADDSLSPTKTAGADPVDGRLQHNKILINFEQGIALGGPVRWRHPTALAVNRMKMVVVVLDVNARC